MPKSTQTPAEPPWLIESKKSFRELYVELDAILKGIDRFFNIENLPFEMDSFTDKTFYNELVVVRDSILRTLGILEVVVPENKRNAYWFRKFAESKFLSDRKRDTLRKNLYDSDDPEQSVFLLYDSLVNLKGIVTDILKSRHISYLSFKNIGDLICREIRENDYMNPFRKDINSDYDVIGNQKISDIVKGIGDRKLKRVFSMILILLFRQLRYLNCIDITTRRKISISCGILLLSVLKSEVRLLVHFLENQEHKPLMKNYQELLSPITFQLSMEHKRVFNQELRDILQQKNILNLRGKIENSHGILKNVIEQCIVQIAQFFEPSIHGEDVFSNFITKVGQSMKLREDIFILHRILSLFERNMDEPQKRKSFFDSLKNYMMYFESFTFRLLRYDDYEEFVKFFRSFMSEMMVDELSERDLVRLSDKVHNFKIFLDATLGHVNNRTELRDHQIDIEKIEQLLRQYIQQ